MTVSPLPPGSTRRVSVPHFIDRRTATDAEFATVLYRIEAAPEADIEADVWPCYLRSSCEPNDHTYSWPCDYAPGTGQPPNGTQVP